MKKVLDEIAEERARQDEKWGGPAHDDEHVTADWIRFINNQSVRVHSPDGVDDSRSRLLKIAALAVAGIESIDRKAMSK